jgi:hypothetical protein
MTDRLDLVKADLRELELRLEGQINRVVIRLGALAVTLTGLAVALIRYLPHGG